MTQICDKEGREGGGGEALMEKKVKKYYLVIPILALTLSLNLFLSSA